MEVVHYITLTPGLCGKKGRCYNKTCKDNTVCPIGFNNYTVNSETKEETVEVHKQWE